MIDPWIAAWIALAVAVLSLILSWLQWRHTNRMAERLRRQREQDMAFMEEQREQLKGNGE
jgi:hypothetical protein